MHVTMMLADAAHAVGGKLYILGGGWSIIGPDPMPIAIALTIAVPWNEANTTHQLRLVLVDEDGQAVQIPTATGDHPFDLSTPFEVGRPAGLRAGTPLDFSLAINLAPFPLPAGRVFVLRCFINDRTEEHWQVRFSTRPAPLPPPPPATDA
jgi:hypothetical protein